MYLLLAGAAQNTLLGMVGIMGLTWFQEPDGVFQMIGRSMGIALPGNGTILAITLVVLVAPQVWRLWKSRQAREAAVQGTR